MLGDPWLGVPVRGRNAAGRADACWPPVAPRLTPHGLRHTHKTLMDGLDTPSKLKDERMGHIDGSVQARYSHITADVRRQLLDGLTDLLDAALDQRLRYSGSSPVGVLDALLRERDRPLLAHRISPYCVDTPEDDAWVARLEVQRRAVRTVRPGHPAHSRVSHRFPRRGAGSGTCR